MLSFGKNDNKSTIKLNFIDDMDVNNFKQRYTIVRKYIAFFVAKMISINHLLFCHTFNIEFCTLLKMVTQLKYYAR